MCPFCIKKLLCRRLAIYTVGGGISSDKDKNYSQCQKFNNMFLMKCQKHSNITVEYWFTFMFLGIFSFIELFTIFVGKVIKKSPNLICCMIFKLNIFDDVIKKLTLLYYINLFSLLKDFLGGSFSLCSGGSKGQGMSDSVQTVKPPLKI